MVKRPDVPQTWVTRVRTMVQFPEVHEEDAWTGVRWRIGQHTFAHIFGGEDQLFRITFRAPGDEVAAFVHMGLPYFRVGGNAVGIIVNDDTDWTELGELLTDSYRLQAPARLADQILTDQI